MIVSSDRGQITVGHQPVVFDVNVAAAEGLIITPGQGGDIRRPIRIPDQVVPLPLRDPITVHVRARVDLILTLQGAVEPVVTLDRRAVTATVAMMMALTGTGRPDAMTANLLVSANVVLALALIGAANGWRVEDLRKLALTEDADLIDWDLL